MKPTQNEWADSADTATSPLQSAVESTFCVLSWNLSGLRSVECGTLLSHISQYYRWDVILFQEGFFQLDGVDCGNHSAFVPSELFSGTGCLVIFVHERWAGRAKQVSDTSRWVAVEFDSGFILVSL